MAARYEKRKGSFLRVARRALSTDFWSSARPLLTFLAWKEGFSTGGVARLALYCITYLGLLALLEESLLARLVRLLLPGEVGVTRNLVNNTRVNAADVDLCPGGDNVAGVDTSEGDTVDLERTGDEEDTLVEGLQENDTLSTEATGEENENGTRLEGGARLVWTNSLADLW